MADHPILFTGEMVRAILSGAKTQTRRVIKPSWSRCLDLDDEDDQAAALAGCPYGSRGDRLWVKETWQAPPSAWPGETERGEPIYRATHEGPPPDKWRPSIFMPKWAARIWLDVVSVRVERVQEIGEEDARAEGCQPITIDGGSGRTETPLGAVVWAAGGGIPARDAFAGLWDSINAKRGYSWASNPWVWRVEFRRSIGGCR